MVLLDANFLLHILLPQVPNCGPADQQAVEQLFARLQKKRERILIPTPVLGEVLVHSGNARAEHVQILRKATRFRIVSFDEVAAIQASEVLERDLKDRLTIKAGSQSERAVIKVDRQIVQIAKIERVRFIYSNDDGVAKLGKRAGITVIDFDTIGLHLNPLPLLQRGIPPFEEEQSYGDGNEENNELKTNSTHPASIQTGNGGRTESETAGEAQKQPEKPKPAKEGGLGEGGS